MICTDETECLHEDLHEEVKARLGAVIMNEFCEAMRRTGLPPMVVMRLAARAMGSVYREVADSHRGPDACPCGWRPHEADVELLCSAMLAEAEGRRHADLLAMRPAGNA